MNSFDNKAPVDPPQWAQRFLLWFCPSDLAESIAGDLQEEFDYNLTVRGPRYARWRYIWTTLRFFHPSILLRNKKVINFIPMRLFKSHLTVAWRSMLRYRFYSLINILGLSLAIAFVFLSYLFIYSELSFDDFHENKERIYRLYTYSVDPETGEQLGDELSGVTPIPLGPAVKSTVPDVIEYTRYGSSSGLVIVDNEPQEEVISFVDPSFLTLFSFPMEAGISSALEDPKSVVISTSIAEKYFRDQDPMGVSLQLNLNDSVQSFQVTGVIDNMEGKSSIPFNILLPFARMEMVVPAHTFDTYRVAFVETYIMTDKPLDRPITETLSAAIVRDGDHRARLMADTEPLGQVHLNPEIEGIAAFTNPEKVWIMAGLGLLVLLVAVINFVTLSTGHAMNRMKEIGIRKTLGARKNSLKVQLTFEAMMVTLVSGVLGIGIALTVLPKFNELIDVNMLLQFEPIHFLFFLALALLISLIAGGVQSVVLVSYSAISSLKGVKLFSTRENWINQSLIVVQFALSIMLIIATWVIRNQMHYIQNKDLGFEQERLVQVDMHSSDDRQSAELLVERYRAAVSSHPQIIGVAGSMNSFREPWTQLSFRQDDESVENLYYNQVDKDFVQMMNIKLKEGKGLDVNPGQSILVNQKLVDHFGWEDPFSAQIPGKNFSKSHQIVGVIEDFHFSSLHNTIEPLILALSDEPIATGITGLNTYVWPSNLHQLMVRVGPGDMNEALKYLEATWLEVNPDKPFNYQFVDDILAQNYAEEARWRRIIDSASVFALIIAWMGLLGLTRLSVQKRVKEIGIRKVLGSSVFRVTSLLSKRFLVMVLLANLMAWPLAWMGLQQWLEGFSYRVELNPFIFLGAALFVLVLSMVSVGFQAIRAASANPVESLRYE